MTNNTAPQMYKRHGIPFELSPLGECSLGDVVGLPDGRALTVRSIALLQQAQASMAGFVILGECEQLVSAPSRAGIPHNIYLPVGSLSKVRGAQVVAEGACAYWAPHLPAHASAMGELLFRVIDVAGSVEPWVIVYRGPEVLVFMPTSPIDGGAFHVTRMPRAHGLDNFEVVRHAATVQPLPHAAPAQPAQVPASVPAEAPSLVPSR